MGNRDLTPRWQTYHPLAAASGVATLTVLLLLIILGYFFQRPANFATLSLLAFVSVCLIGVAALSPDEVILGLKGMKMSRLPTTDSGAIDQRGATGVPSVTSVKTKIPRKNNSVQHRDGRKD